MERDVDATITGAITDFFSQLNDPAQWQARFGGKAVLAGYILLMLGGAWLVIRIAQRRRRQ